MIKYLVGDATNPEYGGKKLIVHICNDVGAWGKGFVVALSKKNKTPELEYRKWAKEKYISCGYTFELGNVQLAQFTDNTYVVNMVAQHGIMSPANNKPIRYESLESCLEKVCVVARSTCSSVHMPRIGCGLAGGSWSEIEPIVKRTLSDKGIHVFVYDLVK